MSFDHLTTLDGRPFAVVMVNSEKEDDVIMLLGIAHWNGENLLIKREDHPSFPIPDHALDRIQPVSNDIKSVLGHADFWITLHVWPKPENAKDGEYAPTGLKWPTNCRTRRCS